MSVNLLTAVQSGLGYPELKKIDPNIQEIKSSTDIENRKGQALITAVLAGIYRLAKSEEGLHDIANEDLLSNWSDIIFENNKTELVDRIAVYASMAKENVEPEMNKIAVTAIGLIRDNTKAGKDLSSIRSFVTSQRNNILPYIPGDLHLGDFLNDTTIDDRTNKMEGPISSLMHKIESGFSSNETKEEAEAHKKSDY